MIVKKRIQDRARVISCMFVCRDTVNSHVGYRANRVKVTARTLVAATLTNWYLIFRLAFSPRLANLGFPSVCVSPFGDARESDATVTNLVVSAERGVLLPPGEPLFSTLLDGRPAEPCPVACQKTVGPVKINRRGLWGFPVLNGIHMCTNTVGFTQDSRLRIRSKGVGSRKIWGFFVGPIRGIFLTPRSAACPVPLRPRGHDAALQFTALAVYLRSKSFSSISKCEITKYRVDFIFYCHFIDVHGAVPVV